MLTTIDIPEALRNEKITKGMTWLGVIKCGLHNISDFEYTKLKEEYSILQVRCDKLRNSLNEYIKRDQERQAQLQEAQKVV